MSETHFFGKDVSRFRVGLRAAKSAHRYCITDQTSLRRNLTSQTAWKGVGVLSRHPTRALPHDLPQPVLDSGRALLFTTLLGDAWISGAVVYGEPNGHHYPRFMKNNEFLLHHVVAHVCNLCSGPRFISGDWNVVQDSLPVFGLLTQAGFRDVQDVALEKWGLPIQVTCKGRTRKDFLYISPELQDLLLSVEVLPDVWPDHSVLVGRFRALRLAPPTWIWPMPDSLPWPRYFAQNVVWSASDGDMTASYAGLWKNIESSACEQSPCPVASRMLGRAALLAPKKVQAKFAPVKAGRKGDLQPEYFGPSLRHSQWMRQARRLQAFARLTTNESPQLGSQKAEAWGAVIRAKGFYTSFADWWWTMKFKTGGAPECCPMFPPNHDVAIAMFDSMVLAVRNFEMELRRSSRQYARYRRDQNPNLVFADIRPPAVPGVDVLLQPIRAVVESVDPDEGLIVLDSPCSFRPDVVIACAGRPLDVIHHSDDAIWVSDVEGVQLGDEVRQTRFVGSHADLEREFVQVWRDRWMRHADVPPERWNVITNFAKQHMPRIHAQWGSMQPSDVRQIVRCKKKSTSPGFDGVTLADLKSMPESVLSAFCDMFRQIEITGCWPSQLIDGRVVSLAKVQCPGSPADFRPITVFGLLYRIWSSFHSKHALSTLDSILPDTLYGSRPGRYAAQIWAKLLWTVEHSFLHSVDLTGVVADLQKAFNMIPRLAVFEIAGHIGLPGHMLVAWAGALSQMKRRFLLRGSLTQGVPSVTGFPEGCGLSCVAMVLIDHAFHLWMQAFFPMCTALTYVDDWQLLCSHSSMIIGAKRCLDQFVEAVDLQLDAKKTYAWSVTPQGRQCLRSGGFTVVLAAKNLGAHVQVSRKHTNATLMERIAGMVMLWPRLRLSACRYRAKVRALLVAAWPRALHAIAATAVSDATMHSLRTGALKGLDADWAGSNAWVHFGMVEHPLVDPEFWSIIQTIRCVRDCGDRQQVCHAMTELTSGSQVIPENSITSTLLSRLQTFGWHVDAFGKIHDMFGVFSLFHVSIAEIVLRAQWAWQCVVAQQVAHRPGLRDLHFADPVDTRAFLASISAADQELFHRCLNGSHITQEAKSYCQEGGSTLCPYCACTDSRFHRFWVCDQFQHERADVSPDVWKLIPDAPDFLTSYGWSVRPHTLFAWLQYLDALHVPPAVPFADQMRDVHIFTDGSCMNQAFPTCRLAAWAIVLADFDGPVDGCVLDSGPLPGLMQSSYRSEIFAVLRALQVMRQQTGKVSLWSDCKAVVTRLRKLLAGGEPKPNSAHADLWLCIHECLSDFRPGQVVITKVTAHVHISSARTPLEEWCCKSNAFADRAANLAQWRRPASFWSFFDKHVASTTACMRFSREVQQVILRISRAVVRNDDGKLDHDMDDVATSPPVPADAWQPVSALAIPAQAVRWYGDEVVRLMLSWFWQSTFQSSHEVIWISQYQLYIDFLKSGELAPTKIDRWRAGRCTPHMDMLAVPFQTRVRWFSKVLKESLRHLGHACTYRYCRPFSRSLFLHTGCLALPWSPVRVDAIDEWILSFCPAGVQRTSKVIEGLPFAARDDRFPTVWLTSA